MPHLNFPVQFIIGLRLLSYVGVGSRATSSRKFSINFVNALSEIVLIGDWSSHYWLRLNIFNVVIVNWALIYSLFYTVTSLLGLL